MALYGVRVQVLGRSDNRSAIAAASYRSGEKLWDERQGRFHFKQRSDVIHTEILLPDDAPVWARQASRETLWNAVERAEKRKDAQLCREIRITIPREFDPAHRISVVRAFVQSAFVARGMAADIAWHEPRASDGGTNPHAHVLLTMRPFSDTSKTGFGLKSRHDMIPDPQGRMHPDGRPVLVSSNPDSWNDVAYYESCRAKWQDIANAELARIGSAERIDRRSYVERGIAKVAQPMLGMAYHAKRLYGALQSRYGQFLACRLYADTERRASAAFQRLDRQGASPVEHIKTANRFIDWFDRQIERLTPAAPERAPPRERPDPSPSLER